MRIRKALVHALLLAALARASAELIVEHSLDGGATYKPYGTIAGNIVTDGDLTWNRPELSAAERKQLEAVAQADGFYTVRARPSKGAGAPLLASSVRASCLLGPGPVSEQAELQVHHGGSFVAFTYSVPSCVSSAKGGSTSTSSSSESNTHGSLPVRVVYPRVAPSLAIPEPLIGEFAEVPSDFGDLGSLGPQTLDPNARPRAAATAAAAPPPDERTWLQKNWLFVAAGALMVFNVFAKANMPPPPGQGGAPAPGGGAPARRG